MQINRGLAWFQSPGLFLLGISFTQEPRKWTTLLLDVPVRHTSQRDRQVFWAVSDEPLHVCTRIIIIGFDDLAIRFYVKISRITFVVVSAKLHKNFRRHFLFQQATKFLRRNVLCSPHFPMKRYEVSLKTLV